MIGIIAAMEVELELLKKSTEISEERKISGMTFYRGTYGGKEVVFAVCADGKVNAAVCAEIMVLEYKPTLLINTGVAGGLSPTLHVPDVAIATATVEHDYDLSPLGYEKSAVLYDNGHKSIVYFEADKRLYELMAEAAKERGVHAETGVIVTGDQFIADEETKAALVKNYNGIACEMEGGAIGHVAFINRIPYGVLRAISDTADDGTKFDPDRAAAISVPLLLDVLKKL